MKTWAQYIWHGHRNQWLLFVAMLSIPMASPIVHHFDSEQAYLIFSTVGLLYIVACFATMSISVIQEFSSNERLQLIPNMLRATRHFLLILNIFFLCAALLLCLIHRYETWLTILVAWAVLTGLLTWQFLSPSKALAIATQFLFISPFFVIGFQFQLPHIHHYYIVPTTITIGACYFLLLKGRRHSSTNVVKSRPNNHRPISSSPMRYTSPKVLFRLFGLFGLQQSMLTYWVSLFALCYIGITAGLVLAPDSANAFLIISTLGIALIASHLPFFEEDIQIKSIKPWALIPITHNRTDFTKRLLKDALLSHLKLILPINLLLPLILSDNLDLAFSLAIVTTVISLLCAAFAWLSITKRWKPLFPAIASIILLFASWLLATKFSGELILLAAFSIVACALAFWLYKLAYRSLALADWH